MSEHAEHVMREQLLTAIRDFLTEVPSPVLDDIRGALEREFEAIGPRATTRLAGQLERETQWGYYPPDPLARRIHYVLADRFLPPECRVDGLESLLAIDRRPLAMCSNHLSYADANLVQALLHRAGARDLAERLVAVAGPKVFTSKQRRFSSLCFGTIKVPQSAGVSSDEAVQSARDVAQAARRSIAVARERLRAGDALLLFGEGTRSRTASMQPLLSGSTRYLEGPGTLIVPVGLTGAEVFFPIGGQTIQPTRVDLRIGAPLASDVVFKLADHDRRIVADAVGLAIAEVLPPGYRGVYADADAYPQAREVLEASRIPA